MRRVASAAVAAAAAFAFVPASSASAEELRQPVTAGEAVDLTHEMHEGMSYWPGGIPFKMTRVVDYGDHGYRLHKFEVGENTGTHVDAPVHFVEGHPGVAAIPLKNLIVPAVVIDVQDKAAQDADYLATPGDIEAWEAEHGEIPEGSLVIVNTGWHKKFGDMARYANMDANNVLHFPGYHPDAALLLIDRGVVGVGIDTLSLDHGLSTDFPFHRAMLEADKYQIENLANLDALPPTGASVIVGVLPVREGTQAQARVIALLP